MLKRFFIIILCLLPATVWSQQILKSDPANGGGNTGLGSGEVFSPFKKNQKDSTKTALKVPMEIHQWHVDEFTGDIIPVNADTLQYHFQNWHLTEGYNGAYNYLGNSGSPRQSRLFFDRPTDTKYDFLQPYDHFYLRPGKFFFTDTKSPYTNLSYHFSGNRLIGDDRFKAYFSTNAGKHFGVGFLFDYLFTRGRYDKQATSLINYSLFSFYRSDHYNYNLLASHYRLKQAENGGITDDRYITRPEETNGANSNFTTSDIPVFLDASWNWNEVYDVFFTHNYNFGFYRDKLVADSNNVVKDSVESEFVRVARITHTANFEHHKHDFINYRTPSSYYADSFLPYDSLDRAMNISIKNRLAFSLCEGFSRFAFADITAFVSYTYNRYLLPDTLLQEGKEFERKYNENLLYVGGNISSKRNKYLNYNVDGEVAILGDELGAFNINGDVEFNFNLWKKKMQLAAEGYVKNNRPSFFYRHYHSEHFWWDNDFNKEFRTRIVGKFKIPSWQTEISAGFENIKNYTYLANEDISINGGGRYLKRYKATQYNSNLQILYATLKQSLKFGILNIDAEATYQKSSNKDILPLPALNAYANIYLKFKIAKVLHTEIGADAWYFTKYYAPDYSPALGQYVQQNQSNKIKIGNYPIVNVYANFLLKQARFYVKYYHLNKGTGSREYFLVPHHPINPAVFWFGLSWNFYN